MRLRSAIAMACVVGAMCWPAGAQGGRGGQLNVQAPGGTITGHVYCTDTQRPARFADVEVLRPPDTSAPTDGGRGRGFFYAPIARGKTALDGSFSIPGVPAGDYYVMGSMTGYVNPALHARMAQTPITGVPMTHVDSNGSADVLVSMDRGAVVSGRLTYDDGSPVPGVSVRLRSLTANGGGGGALGAGLGGSFGGGFGGFGGFGVDVGFAQTDDRGVYRISGIPPGRYAVAATVLTETPGKPQPGRGGFRGPQPVLNIYAPATMHKTEARAIEVHGGETIEGVDVQVSLHGLRTLKGSVEAKADGHMVNGGMVMLADAADNSLTRMAGVDGDGVFTVEYLPPGTYTLTITGEDRSPDTPGNRGGVRLPAKRYERATATVTVGDHDVTVDPVQLDEAKTTAAAGSSAATP